MTFEVGDKVKTVSGYDCGSFLFPIGTVGTVVEVLVFGKDPMYKVKANNSCWWYLGEMLVRA